MTPRELLANCAAAGITLAVEAGRLRVTGPTEAVREFTPLLREHRDELLALLTEGPDSDHRRAKGPSAAPVPAEGVGDPGTPCGWQAADHAYQAHAWRCPTCSSAGRGYGSRCPTGAELWKAYTAQPGPATSKPERQPQPVPDPGTRPHPFDRERRAWTPATDAEIARMAATFERARALGFSSEEADFAADVVHWSYRLGDTRPCLACAHLRAGTASRWHCVAQRLPLPLQLVVGPHRCETFQGLQEGYRGD